MTKVIVLCSACGWKRISDRDDVGLCELNNDSLSSKKYRCPGCGRAVSPRKFSDPQGDQDRKNKEESIKKNEEKWRQENLDFHARFMEEAEHAE
ncbi:hypothetical protein EBT16_00700 [bacterium]|nr:hypothetical protein [bacterium]